MIDYNELLERQYKLSIDARDKLNDSFHKWMTYYYVANGAVLIAITTLSSKQECNKGILALSIIGIFVCTLWNLSCRGYYYWSKSWINIIISIERKIIKEDTTAGVYSVFSKKVADEESSPWTPTKAANISTPKLTMIFSFSSMISWLLFSEYQFWAMNPSFTTFSKSLITIFASILPILVYFYILPNKTKSRENGYHSLI